MELYKKVQLFIIVWTRACLNCKSIPTGHPIIQVPAEQADDVRQGIPTGHPIIQVPAEQADDVRQGILLLKR